MSSIRMSNGQGTNGTGGGGGGGGGGRKMNAANHLLNFSLPTRADRAVVPRRSRKGGGGEGARWQVFNKESEFQDLLSHPSSFPSFPPSFENISSYVETDFSLLLLLLNRPLEFVNASFRFMLKATGDFTVYFTDSDILFHWPDILQVLVPTPSPSLVRESSDEGRASSRSREPSLPSCPICLGVPVAPRMTKCGHIYCFSCVLHYLALSEEKYARCPICTDTIYSRDLKCVTWSPAVLEPTIPTPSTSLGPVAAITPSHLHSHPSNDHDHAEIPSDFEDIPSAPATTRTPLSHPSTYPTHIFRLIQRPQHTTLALPRSSTWPSSALLPHEAPFQFLPDVSTFARFMLATPAYLVGELERDVRQLDAEKREQKRAGEDGVGLGFIDAARAKVVEQISRARAELETPGVLRKIQEVEAVLEALEKRGEVEKEREERSRVLLLASTEAATPSAPLPPPSFFPSANAPSFIPSSSSANYSPPSSLPNESSPTTATPTPHAFLNHLGHSWSASSPSDPSSNLTTVSAPATPYPSTSPTKSSLLNPNPRTNQRKPHLAPPPEPSFFFYQSYGGQQIYLHPLDIRVLLHEYKSYSAFPSLLKVGVEGAEEGTMNDDLRRRCKYLAHLPTGCSILFVETDLSTLVSPATLAAFDAPLKQRRQRRRERGKREERDRRRAEAAEREKEGGGLDRRAPDDGRRGGGGWGGEGGDEFEEALERSLLESQRYEGDDIGAGSSTSGSFPPHPTLSSSLDRTPGARPPPPSSSPPSLGAWGARSFASALHTSSSSSSYGRTDVRRNEVDEEEVAALWRRFDAQEGERNRMDREGESSAGGSGGVPAASSSNIGGGGGGKKSKKKGQKVLLTGGGRRG